jgi:hypothetical protein
MTTTTIQNKITRAIELKRVIADAKREYDEIKAALVVEASGREEERRPTEGGGWSWEQLDREGNLVRVTEPARKLKSTLDPESKGFPKIKEAAGRAWSLLFAQVPAYAPVEGFRDKAVAHLGRDAAKLIKLCTTESETKVAFEVARTNGAGA